MLKKNKIVLIVGCSRFGSSLAKALSSKNYDVTIIDKSESSFVKLSENFGGYTIVGDGKSTEVLEGAGIKNSDIVIVATDDDNTNSLISQIASRLYNVNKVYIRLKDIEKNFLVENYNIQVICPYSLCLKEFENISSIELED